MPNVTKKPLNSRMGMAVTGPKNTATCGGHQHRSSTSVISCTVTSTGDQHQSYAVTITGHQHQSHHAVTITGHQHQSYHAQSPSQVINISHMQSPSQVINISHIMHSHQHRSSTSVICSHHHRSSTSVISCTVTSTGHQHQSYAVTIPVFSPLSLILVFSLFYSTPPPTPPLSPSWFCLPFSTTPLLVLCPFLLFCFFSPSLTPPPPPPPHPVFSPPPFLYPLSYPVFFSFSNPVSLVLVFSPCLYPPPPPPLSLILVFSPCLYTPPLSWFSLPLYTVCLFFLPFYTGSFQPIRAVNKFLSTNQSHRQAGV